MMGDWSWNMWRASQPSAYPGVQQHYSRYPYAPPLPPKEPEPCCCCQAPGPYYVDHVVSDLPSAQYYGLVRKEWALKRTEYARCDDKVKAELIAAVLNEQAAKGSTK
jgi:hypothetical protein